MMSKTETVIASKEKEKLKMITDLLEQDPTYGIINLPFIPSTAKLNYLRIISSKRN